MDNIIIDLRIENIKLRQENQALKEKMTLMYSNWKYDYDKYEILKQKCRGECFAFNDAMEEVKKV